jgi:2-aminoethylphosphonate-pyruvate transaminase
MVVIAVDLQALLRMPAIGAGYEPVHITTTKEASVPGTPENPWLLNPGPCNVSEAVRHALQTVDICHREHDYLEVQKQVRGLLLKAFERDPEHWTSALITGSGTAAMEMALSSAISASGAVLVVINGVYGERIAKMAHAHHIEVIPVVNEWNETPDLKAIEQTLGSHPEIEAVAMVHHETTTGLINPVAQVASLCKNAGKRLILDTISGLGGERLNLDDVDLAVCTANKLVQGIPGVSFCLLRRDFAEDIKGYPPRSVYLNLSNYIHKQESSGTPFTPAVQVTYALRQALVELVEETLDGRIQRMESVSARLRSGFASLGLELFLPEALCSNTITTLRLPAGVHYPELHDRMRAKGYVIYAGQGDLAKVAFRIANMGLLTAEAIDGVIDALKESIS